MSTQDKVNQMIDDLKETLEQYDLDDALTILSMLKSVEQLDEWMAD